MKFNKILINFVILLLINESLQVSILKKLSPKAHDLNNQFGLTHSQNKAQYGPQQQSIDVSKLMVKKSDGSFTNLLTAHQLQSACQITQNTFFQICSSINDCGLCGASPHCGWCQSTQKCLPGSISECACSDECPKAWLFDQKKCNSTVVSGSLVNIAPDAKGLITPEIATNRINVQTVSHEYTLADVPVVNGIRIEKKVGLYQRKSDGGLVNAEIDVKVPNVETQQIPVDKVTYSQHQVDTKTGKVIEKDDKKVLHGIDQDQVKEKKSDEKKSEEEKKK